MDLPNTPTQLQIQPRISNVGWLGREDGENQADSRAQARGAEFPAGKAMPSRKSKKLRITGQENPVSAEARVHSAHTPALTQSLSCTTSFLPAR